MFGEYMICNQVSKYGKRDDDESIFIIFLKEWLNSHVKESIYASVNQYCLF